MAYDSGILTNYHETNAIITPAFATAINFKPARWPLQARLGVVPLGAPSFKLVSSGFRPRTTTINEGGTYTNSDTTLTVTDGSSFMPGDLIEIESEVLHVTAVSGNNLTVARGYAGSSAASHADSTTVYLIGNSRTGAEISQTGVSRTPSVATQYAQTFQHPWQVGGSLESTTDIALPPGFTSIQQKFEWEATGNCMDDVETSYLYGRGVAQAASTGRAASYGARWLCTTNKTTSPTNASAYTPDDLVRDTVNLVRPYGGHPDVLMVSSNFLRAFAKWGLNAQRVPAGETTFGVPIATWAVPFLGEIAIVENPAMRPFTAWCFDSQEVRQRIKRGVFSKPRGSLGDATEGDVIAEGCIEIDNPDHHAWVEGITAFSN